MTVRDMYLIVVDLGEESKMPYYLSSLHGTLDPNSITFAVDFDVNRLVFIGDEDQARVDVC